MIKAVMSITYFIVYKNLFLSKISISNNYPTPMYAWAYKQRWVIKRVELWHWVGCVEGGKVGIRAGRVGGYDHNLLHACINHTYMWNSQE